MTAPQKSSMGHISLDDFNNGSMNSQDSSTFTLGSKVPFDNSLDSDEDPFGDMSSDDDDESSSSKSSANNNTQIPKSLPKMNRIPLENFDTLDFDGPPTPKLVIPKNQQIKDPFTNISENSANSSTTSKKFGHISAREYSESKSISIQTNPSVFTIGSENPFKSTNCETDENPVCILSDDEEDDSILTSNSNSSLTKSTSTSSNQNTPLSTTKGLLRKSSNSKLYSASTKYSHKSPGSSPRSQGLKMRLEISSFLPDFLSDCKKKDQAILSNPDHPEHRSTVIFLTACKESGIPLIIPQFPTLSLSSQELKIKEKIVISLIQLKDNDNITFAIPASQSSRIYLLNALIEKIDTYYPQASYFVNDSVGKTRSVRNHLVKQYAADLEAISNETAKDQKNLNDMFSKVVDNNANLLRQMELRFKAKIDAYHQEYKSVIQYTTTHLVYLIEQELASQPKLPSKSSSKSSLSTSSELQEFIDSSERGPSYPLLHPRDPSIIKSLSQHALEKNVKDFCYFNPIVLSGNVRPRIFHTPKYWTANPPESFPTKLSAFLASDVLFFFLCLIAFCWTLCLGKYFFSLFPEE